MVELRDYQQEVYDRVKDKMRQGFQSILVVLPCRSGKSYIMAKMIEDAGKKGNRCIVLAHRRELLNQHDEILSHLSNCRTESVFTEVKHPGDEAIIFIDEAHLSEASSYKRVIEERKTSLKKTLTIGFTATPTRLSGESLSIFDCIVVGIDPQSLVDRGCIADYEYYAPDIALDLDGVSKVAGDYNNKELTEIMMSSKIYGDVIDSYMKLAKDQQAVAYCTSINHSKLVCEEFNGKGIKSKHIDGSMSPRDRQAIIDSFKRGEFKILCNCNIISEGITLPSASVAILLRPTQSLALYIQQSMRVLTPNGDKKSIIIDCVGNFHRHGLPTEYREWTLEGVKKKHKEFDKDGNYTIRSCPECFMVFKTSDTCPYCGFKIVPKGRELKQIKEVELKKIEAQEKEALLQHKKEMRMEVGMARSISDLMEIAKKRGYKAGWVYYQAKIKGIRR